MVNRLYDDLAWIWPLWEPVEDYQEKTVADISRIRKSARIEVKSILDVGCGGGKNSFYLKKEFEVTGIDLSEQMLENAQRLNPECRFIKADMRDFKIDQLFDAIFVNDSIAYMCTREDLLSVFRNAYQHLKTGGALLVCAEKTIETFVQNRTNHWKLTQKDLDIVIVENNYRPLPSDSVCETTYIYLIRKNGQLRIEHDFHKNGLFSLNTWRNVLDESGFTIDQEIDDEANMNSTFVCIK